MQERPDQNANIPKQNIPNVGNVPSYAAPTQTPFTDVEWQALVDAPIKACMAMVAVSPSGIVSMMQEARAMKKNLDNIQQQGTTNPWLKTLATHINDTLENAKAGGRKNTMTAMQDAVKTPDAARQQGIAACQQAVTIVNKATPQDARTYKDLVYGCARNVAEAGSEGGFLGIFGGQKVSDPERSLLTELANILDIKPS